MVKDFGIEIYSAEKFFNFLINNYWWIIALIAISLLAFLIYKKRDKFKKKEKAENVKYIFHRRDLLPK